MACNVSCVLCCNFGMMSYAVSSIDILVLGEVQLLIEANTSMVGSMLKLNS